LPLSHSGGLAVYECFSRCLVTTFDTTLRFSRILNFCNSLINWRIRQDLNLQPSDPKNIFYTAGFSLLAKQFF